jgi:hypothetical protein
MVEDLCEPALAGEKGRAFLVMVDVVLLKRDPVVTEAPAKKVRLADVILGRN